MWNPLYYDLDRFQERLISIIAQSTNLTELSLRNCQMDDVCVGMLFDVLTKSSICCLRKLILDGNLTIPEVGKCTPDDSLCCIASSFICNFLKHSKTLEVLSLSQCRGILITRIAEGLKASPCSTLSNVHN